MYASEGLFRNAKMERGPLKSNMAVKRSIGPRSNTSALAEIPVFPSYVLLSPESEYRAVLDTCSQRPKVKIHDATGREIKRPPPAARTFPACPIAVSPSLRSFSAGADDCSMLTS
jgi:hypothetical protein